MRGTKMWFLSYIGDFSTPLRSVRNDRDVSCRAKSFVSCRAKSRHLLLALLLLLSSCSKPQGQETAFVPVPDLNSPIEFSEQLVEPETKGLDPVTDALEGIKAQRFGVFSWWNPIGEVFDELYNPANLYQQNNDVVEVDFTTTPRKWKCNPSAYWPFACNLSFFAYAPYLEHTQPYLVGEETVQPELRFPSADYTQGMPRASYSPNPDITHQVDLCIAAPVFDREPSSTPIHFAFKHALTRIRLYIRAIGDDQGGYLAYRIDDVIINGIVGTNTFTYQDDADEPFVWDEVTASTPKDGNYHLTAAAGHLTQEWVMRNNSAYDPAVLHDLTTYTAANVSNAPNGSLYFLPQDLFTPILEIGVGQYVKGTSTLLSILPPIRKPLPTAQSWHAGETIAYLITVDVANYVILDITPVLTPWADAENTHPTQRIY